MSFFKHTILSDPLERQKYDQRLNGSHLKVGVVDDEEYALDVNDFSVNVDNLSSADWVSEGTVVRFLPLTSKYPRRPLFDDPTCIEPARVSFDEVILGVGM